MDRTQTSTLTKEIPPVPRTTSYVVQVLPYSLFKISDKRGFG
jgi:hypothetical protein